MVKVVAYYPGAGGSRYCRMLQNLEFKEKNKIYDIHVLNQHPENRYLFDPVVTNREYVLTHCMNSKLISTHFPQSKITFINAPLKKCLQREWALAGHERYKQKQKQVERNFDRLQHYAGYKNSNWPSVSTIKELEELPENILFETNADFNKLVNKTHAHQPDLQTLIDDLAVKVESAYETIHWHLEYYKKYPVDMSQNFHDIVDIDRDDTEFADVMRKELDSYSSEIFNEVWKLANA